MSDNAGQPARVVNGVEVIGPPECPLMLRRTLLSGRLGKLLLHEFMPGASDKDPHDHPRGFLTIVWRGGYDDVATCQSCFGAGWVRRATDDCPRCGGHGETVERLRAPAIRVRAAGHAHITKVHDDGAKTVVIMGPLRRDWGFIREGRWWPWRVYERTFGMAFRCDDD